MYNLAEESGPIQQALYHGVDLPSARKKLSLWKASEKIETY
jgi:hypothetical protein